MRRLTAPLLILWTSPWTLWGLSIGCLALATGGRAQRTGRVLEFYGGFARLYLRATPLVGGASAVTFGHTILARDKSALESSRQHELVHVRQYERWGPAFIPAYLFFWLVFWIRGKNPYRDNPFEREAFEEAS